MSAIATDFIKRFTPTPIEARFEVSGTSVRLETNCQPVADQLRRAFAPCTASALVAPDFVLRVVAESEGDPDFDTVPTVHRMRHDGLSFISLGHKSFLACDREGRQGISFISQNLATDEKWLSRYFLPALISMLTESIGAP
jgi:hypothetical protein